MNRECLNRFCRNCRAGQCNDHSIAIGETCLALNRYLKIRDIFFATAQPQENKERAENGPASPVQQLKAEIAALNAELIAHCKDRSYTQLDRFIERLRQLSAI